MTNSLERLTLSIDNLEGLLLQKLSGSDESASSAEFAVLQTANEGLKKELEILKKDYQKLQETSKDVIGELNHSIQIIEDYFKKQNANN